MGAGCKSIAQASCALILTLSLSGCGADLGECDESMLGGSTAAGMTTPHLGQMTIGASCAGGRCHSETASGAQRLGAPAELDFDVLVGAGTTEELSKLARGSAKVNDWSAQIWNQVESGAMPPPPPAGAGELSSMQKEQVRNWLACGAPVIAPAPSTGAATWDAIWSELATGCVGCHSQATAAAGGGFVLGELGDACGSRANLVNQMSTNCAGQTYVVPGNAAGSLLLQKLSGTQDMCGTPMPPIGLPNGLRDQNPDLVARIETWIGNNAPAPAGCP